MSNKMFADHEDSYFRWHTGQLQILYILANSVSRDNLIVA